MRLIVVLIFFMGCSKRNQEVCCETADECAAISTKEVVACEIGVCVGHECVDIGACDGNEDCEAPDTCVDETCTAPPAPPDAALKPAFDVAYGKEWCFSVAGPVGLSIVFINTDVSPLSMTTIQVRSLDDDHPTAFVRIETTPSSTEIPPGFAGGKLSPVDEAVLVDTGIVTEPRIDTEINYGSIELVDAPVGTYDIVVDAVLGLEGLDVPLHMTLHMQPGPQVCANMEVGTRAQIFKE